MTMLGSLYAFLQLPVLSFRVDQLPMSETVMGIWGSLVRLAGVSGGAISSTALPASPFQPPPSLTQSHPVSKTLHSSSDQQECEHRIWNLLITCSQLYFPSKYLNVAPWLSMATFTVNC